jgi:hypothetical protein
VRYGGDDSDLNDALIGAGRSRCGGRWPRWRWLLRVIDGGDGEYRHASPAHGEWHPADRAADNAFTRRSAPGEIAAAWTAPEVQVPGTLGDRPPVGAIGASDDTADPVAALGASRWWRWQWRNRGARRGRAALVAGRRHRDRRACRKRAGSWLVMAHDLNDRVAITGLLR